MGNITFFHRDGKCFYKSKPVTPYVLSPSRMVVASLHKRALDAWRTLNHSVQQQWNLYARNVKSHRPPFADSSRISGYNLFVSAYHGFAQLGNEIVPIPQPFVSFPLIAFHYHSALELCSAEAPVLEISFSVSFLEPCFPGRYRLLTRIQLAPLGRGCRPGYMRNILASEFSQDNPSVVTVKVENYRDKWNIFSNAFQLHAKYLLIDTQTDYRDLYRRYSAQIFL